MKSTQTKIITIIVAALIITTCFIIFNQNYNSGVQAQPIRVACVGDSITEWSNYTGKLQEKLGQDYVVGNFGVASTTVLQNTDKPYIKETKFKQAQDFQPDLVIIMLGTNDAKDYNYRNIEAFPEDYIQLINAYASLPDDQKIWLVTPPPIYDNNLGLNNENLEQGVIPSIEDVADNLDLPTIDVYNALINHSEYFIDGVHPNPNGAEVIADKINEVISPENNDYNGFIYWGN